MPGFEPGVTCTQNRHVSRYTTSRLKELRNLFEYQCYAPKQAVKVYPELVSGLHHIPWLVFVTSSIIAQIDKRAMAGVEKGTVIFPSRGILIYMSFESLQSLNTATENQENIKPSSWAKNLMLTLGMSASMFTGFGGNNNSEQSGDDKKLPQVAAENFMGKEKEDFTLKDIIETQMMFSQASYEQTIYSLVDKAFDSEDPMAAFTELQAEIENQTKTEGRFVDYEVITQQIIQHYTSLAKKNHHQKDEYIQTCSTIIEHMSLSSKHMIDSFWEAHTSLENKEIFEELQKEYLDLLHDEYIAKQEIAKSQGIPNAYILNPQLEHYEKTIKNSEKQKEKLKKAINKILPEDAQKILIALEESMFDIEKAQAHLLNMSHKVFAQNEK